MLIVLGSADAKVSLDTWVKRFLYMGIIQCAVAIGIFMSWIPAPEASGLHAFNGERTGYIIDGTFGILAEVAGLWSLSTGRNQLLAFASVISGVANAVLSGYRSYAIAAAFLLVVFGLWTVKRLDWKLGAVMAGMIGALLLVAFTDPTSRAEAMYQRIAGVREYDPSVTWRQIENEQEMYVIRGSPWTGSGWGLVGRMKVAYLGEMPSYGHNFYTAIPARIGIPLTVYLVLSWAALIVAAVKRLRGTADVNVIASCWYAAAIVVVVLGVSVVQNVALMGRALPLFAVFILPVLSPPTPSQKAV